MKINIPELSVHDGRVVCTSENVAEVFNRPLIDLMKRINSLDCSKTFHEANFEPMEAKDGRGKPLVGCRMTRDGFSLWAMTFVGKMEQKEACLNAFTLMEKQQKQEEAKRRIALEPVKEPDPLERIEQIGCIVDQLLNGSTNPYPIGAEIRVELARQAARLAGVKLKDEPRTNHEPREVVQFWSNVRKIGLEKLNHSKQINMIAINLMEYQAIREEMGLPRASKATLSHKFRFSQSMPVVGCKAIRSCRPERAGKTIRCWLFRAGELLPESLAGIKTVSSNSEFIKEAR